MNGGVEDLGIGARSRESERLSIPCPNGVVLVGELDLDLGVPGSDSLGVPIRGVESPLARSALALAMLAIQLGCVFFAALGFGESGLVSALSIQLDLVGLKRFEGLLGGDVAPSSAFVL